jgi:hypothetical protein
MGRPASWPWPDFTEQDGRFAKLFEHWFPYIDRHDGFRLALAPKAAENFVLTVRDTGRGGHDVRSRSLAGQDGSDTWTWS